MIRNVSKKISDSKQVDILKEAGDAASLKANCESKALGLTKLEEISEAIKNGYQCYLYFVCTDDTQINVSRV